MAVNFGGLGGAVKDIFSGIGDFQEASAYGEASHIAEQNAVLAGESTKIQEFQAQRQIQKTLGLQKAQVAGNGLASSGSALDLMRDSASQGALTKNLIQVQGTITQNSYKEEQSAYNGMAAAANMAGAGSVGSGIIGGIASLFGL